jgi:hypothetical protein
MERELILPVKDSNYDKKKLENEIETMKKLLPYIESFNTFVANNDIFDIRTRAAVLRRYRRPQRARSIPATQRSRLVYCSRTVRFLASSRSARSQAPALLLTSRSRSKFVEISKSRTRHRPARSTSSPLARSATSRCWQVPPLRAETAPSSAMRQGWLRSSRSARRSWSGSLGPLRPRRSSRTRSPSLRHWSSSRMPTVFSGTSASPGSGHSLLARVA